MRLQCAMLAKNQRVNIANLCVVLRAFATPETLAELTAYEKEEQLVREQEQARQEAEEREKEVADAQVLRAVMSRLQSAKVRSAVKALLPAVIPRRSGSQKEVKINDNDKMITIRR